jgi:hypothetical protein
MKKYIIVGIIIFFVVVLLTVKFAPTEKDKVARDIKALARNVQNESRAGTLLYLDPEYRDSTGLVYPDLISMLMNLYVEGDSIHVALSDMKVWIDSSRSERAWARCSLDVKVWAKFGPDQALVFGGVIKGAPVMAYLRKNGETYRVYSAIY